jgi:hypothetical protein
MKMLKVMKVSAVLIFLGMVNVASALPQFSCLETEKMAVEIEHPAKYLPFLKDHLKISKNRCVIDIELTKYSYIKRTWQVDVCRGPIHIKYGPSLAEVFKKLPQDGACQPKVSSEKNDEASSFCSSSREILDVIQDRGLVYAAGERDDLSSEHGRFYCLYSLLGHYFQKDFIFSLIKNVIPQEALPDVNVVPQDIQPSKEDPMQNPLKEQEATKQEI